MAWKATSCKPHLSFYRWRIHTKLFWFILFTRLGMVMDLEEVTQVLEVSISLTIKWEQKQNLPYMSTVKLKQVNEYRMLSPMVVINSVHFQVQCFKTVGDKIVYAIWSHNYTEKHKIIHWKFFNYTKTFLSHFYFLMFQNSIIFIYSYIMG